VVLADRVGYAPAGLSSFLTTLHERNKDSTEKQGLFASHPEMKERLEKLASTVTKEKLAATATVEARYARHVRYTPVPLTEITTVEGGAAGVAGGSTTSSKDTKAEEPKKKKGFGLSSLVGAGGGSEKKSAEATASGASKGVDKERNAKGGSNPALVTVKVTATDIAAFKKEGQLN
jgi:hypothetical protein